MFENPQEFGRELRRRRLSAGMSLAALAAAAHFTKGYLSKVENGRVSANRGLAGICDRVLGANGALLALVDREPAPARAAGGLAGLPDGTRHFVGRAGESERLAEVLRGPDVVRACVITGLAGTGKTELAVSAARAAAREFPDGSLFLDLHGHTGGVPELSASDALDRLLRMLDVPGPRIPPDEDGRANLFRDRLAGKRVLLVLDNAASGAQVRPLLPAEARCRVLVTSRHRLASLDDAAHVAVGELAPDDAVLLFRVVAGEFAAADEGVVAEIVELCGRVPLAIRIAAARLLGGGWSLAELRDRLADDTTRFGALDDGERSVAAAFRLSCDHLPTDQARMFPLLAVHPAVDVEVDAAAALAGVERAEAERLLDRLHDAHLVTRRPGGYLAIHDLVRSFAVLRVLPGVDVAERRGAARRLVEYAVARTRAADEAIEPFRYRPPVDLPDAWSFDGDSALVWLRAQWPTLVAVVERAAAEQVFDRCWQLACLLRAFFAREKLSEPWVRSHRVALGAATALGDREAEGMVLNNLGMAHLERCEFAEAATCHARAHELFTVAGNGFGATDARASLAWVRLYQGEPEVAARDLAAALAVYRADGRVRNEAITLRGLALAATARGRYDEAAGHARRAAECAQTPLDAVLTENCLAWVHFTAGDAESARARYERALESARAESVAYEEARALVGLGNVAAAGGDHRAAARLWASADAIPVTLNPCLLDEVRVREELTG
ncbi:tetratricopeptide repeat protein [Saccharothrix australiensis]|uniref:NB-ARC domain-containing protein n=1 Tax=Saccharothrix australiensis TaxID=2072 RepID=A0A495W2K5_9PSEU|nr:tetratricopeptide repeat protein [Saccharothrix australiensis]RKT54078.1 NB-ARC domain-containing protein [Saccharothrix australiensis]